MILRLASWLVSCIQTFSMTYTLASNRVQMHKSLSDYELTRWEKLVLSVFGTLRQRNDIRGGLERGDDVVEEDIAAGAIVQSIHHRCVRVRTG
jgi:hypothetical protein